MYRNLVQCVTIQHVTKCNNTIQYNTIQYNTTRHNALQYNRKEIIIICQNKMEHNILQ